MTIILVPVVVISLYIIYDEMQHRRQQRRLRRQMKSVYMARVRAMLEEEP